MARNEAFPSGVAMNHARIAQDTQRLPKTEISALHFSKVKLIHFEAIQWHAFSEAKCPSVCVGSIAPEPFSIERRSGIGGQHYNSTSGRKR